jgi:hypothetical protein
MPWVRPQHPPTQWNLGAADEAVSNKVLKKYPFVEKFSCLPYNSLQIFQIFQASAFST